MGFFCSRHRDKGAALDPDGEAPVVIEAVGMAAELGLSYETFSLCSGMSSAISGLRFSPITKALNGDTMKCSVLKQLYQSSVSLLLPRTA